MAKLQGGNSYSIITDHLGTPTEAYDEDGKKVWSRELNIYGETRKETGTSNFVPFKYQGQYEDVETGLYYNRYRYYDPNSGVYISQDPIGLASGEANFYSYVRDVNSHVDYFGLASKCSKSFKIKGLVGNRQLRSLTHNEIFNSFKKAGINLTSHAVKRLKDLRTKKLGFATPNDIMKIFNKGQKEVTERAIEQSHAGLTAVISKQTGKIITFTP